jgi:hypothetical protein
MFEGGDLHDIAQIWHDDFMIHYLKTANKYKVDIEGTEQYVGGLKDPVLTNDSLNELCYGSGHQKEFEQIVFDLVTTKLVREGNFTHAPDFILKVLKKFSEDKKHDNASVLFNDLLKDHKLDKTQMERHEMSVARKLNDVFECFPKFIAQRSLIEKMITAWLVKKGYILGKYIWKTKTRSVKLGDKNISTEEYNKAIQRMFDAIARVILAFMK